MTGLPNVSPKSILVGPVYRGRPCASVITPAPTTTKTMTMASASAKPRVSYQLFQSSSMRMRWPLSKARPAPRRYHYVEKDVPLRPKMQCYVSSRVRLNKGKATPGGSRGGKGLTQGEQPLGGRGSDTEPKCRVDPNDGCASGESVSKSFIARRLTRGRSPVRCGGRGEILVPTA